MSSIFAWVFTIVILALIVLVDMALLMGSIALIALAFGYDIMSFPLWSWPAAYIGIRMFHAFLSESFPQIVANYVFGD